MGQDYLDTREGIASLAPYADEDQAPSGLVSALQRNYEAIQGIQGKAPGTAEEDAAIKAALIKQAENAAANAERAKGYRFLELAGAIGSSDQAYNPLAAISGGLKQVAPLFAQDEAAQEKAGLENLMARRELAQRARDQALSGLPTALQLTGYESDIGAKDAATRAKVAIARINADKEKYGGFDIQAMTARANAMAFEQFDKPLDQLSPKDKAKILGEAAKSQQREKQAAQFDANAIRNALGLGNLGLQQSNINQDSWSSSLASFDRSMANDRKLKRSFDDISKQFGPDVALDWKNNQVASIYNASPGVPQRLPMKQLPEGVAALVQKKGGSAPVPQAAPAPKAAGSSTLSAVDQKALEWANANPKDKRADEIKARLGIR
jgi:hypothetical protein